MTWKSIANIIFNSGNSFTKKYEFFLQMKVQCKTIGEYKKYAIDCLKNVIVMKFLITRIILIIVLRIQVTMINMEQNISTEIRRRNVIDD